MGVKTIYPQTHLNFYLLDFRIGLQPASHLAFIILSTEVNVQFAFLIAFQYMCNIYIYLHRHTKPLSLVQISSSGQMCAHVGA